MTAAIKEGEHKLGFSTFGRSRYRDQMDGRDFVEEVMVSVEWSDHNIEFGIRWHDIEPGKPPAARLEMYDDGWRDLVSFPVQRVLTALAVVMTPKHGKWGLLAGHVSVGEVEQALLKLGATDRTPLDAADEKTLPAGLHMVGVAVREVRPEYGADGLAGGYVAHAVLSDGTCSWPMGAEVRARKIDAMFDLEYIAWTTTGPVMRPRR